MCIITMGIFCFAAIFAISCPSDNPLILLIMPAPASTAASAIEDLVVSTEIGTFIFFESVLITGMVL